MSAGRQLADSRFWYKICYGHDVLSRCARTRENPGCIDWMKTSADGGEPKKGGHPLPPPPTCVQTLSYFTTKSVYINISLYIFNCSFPEQYCQLFTGNQFCYLSVTFEYKKVAVALGFDGRPGNLLIRAYSPHIYWRQCISSNQEPVTNLRRYYETLPCCYSYAIGETGRFYPNHFLIALPNHTINT